MTTPNRDSVPEFIRTLEALYDGPDDAARLSWAIGLRYAHLVAVLTSRQTPRLRGGIPWTGEQCRPLMDEINRLFDEHERLIGTDYIRLRRV